MFTVIIIIVVSLLKKGYTLNHNYVVFIQIINFKKYIYCSYHNFFIHVLVFVRYIGIETRAHVNQQMTLTDEYDIDYYYNNVIVKPCVIGHRLFIGDKIISRSMSFYLKSNEYFLTYDYTVQLLGQNVIN